jgi:aminocarboxymuconate-semialdehyde decarboxylase
MGALESPVIDFHVHNLEPMVFEASRNKTVFTGFGANPVSEPRPGAKQLMERMFRPEAILEDMDQRGIDMSVVTSSTVIQGTSWANAQDDLGYCRRCNDQAMSWAEQHPSRLIPSMVLPLQEPDLAMQELRRCSENGRVRVINASSSYKGIYLGDACYSDFWSAVAEQELVVWVHPEGVQDPWFQSFGLWNSLGQSIEETKCMASLIYGGVMHRHPDVRIVMAHGGGYFPHYMGRLDRNAVNRPDSVKNIDGLAPSTFLRHFYYDTCVYDPEVLRVLLQRVGPDRLIMGSDYPVGESDPVAWLRRCGVQGEDLSAIAGGNAAELIGLTH